MTNSDSVPDEPLYKLLIDRKNILISCTQDRINVLSELYRIKSQINKIYNRENQQEIIQIQHDILKNLFTLDLEMYDRFLKNDHLTPPDSPILQLITFKDTIVDILKSNLICFYHILNIEEAHDELKSTPYALTEENINELNLLKEKLLNDLSWNELLESYIEHCGHYLNKLNEFLKKDVTTISDYKKEVLPDRQSIKELNRLKEKFENEIQRNIIIEKVKNIGEGLLTKKAQLDHQHFREILERELLEEKEKPKPYEINLTKILQELEKEAEEAKDKADFEAALINPRKLAKEEISKIHDIIDRSIAFYLNEDQLPREKERIRFLIREDIKMSIEGVIKYGMMFLDKNGKIKNKPQKLTPAEDTEIFLSAYKYLDQQIENRIKLKQHQLKDNIQSTHDRLKDLLFTALSKMVDFPMEDNLFKSYNSDKKRNFFKKIEDHISSKNDQNNKEYKKILPIIKKLILPTNFNPLKKNQITYNEETKLKNFVDISKEGSSNMKRIAFYVLSACILAITLSVVSFIRPNKAISLLKKLCTSSSVVDLFITLGGVGIVANVFQIAFFPSYGNKLSSNNIAEAGKRIDEADKSLKKISEWVIELEQLEIHPNISPSL